MTNQGYYSGHLGNVQSLVLSREGRYLLSADDTGSILVWRVSPHLLSSARRSQNDEDTSRGLRSGGGTVREV